MNNIFNSALKNFGINYQGNKGVDTKMKFSVDPLPGDSGFSQWCAAMQMVSRLPGGIPIEFRKRLWLTLADKHVQSKRIDWKKTRHVCLNEKTNPDDDKLGVQIVKDLHRTGCSMFSGEETEHNQALLKKVLLAYARWNKVVGYCQGFNMLAAIILEVMEWNEENALKVMIYLIEEVLPEGYFANHMRGLSVDMAVFRELLKMRFPVLSQHLDRLQFEAQDSGAGTSYEPPLTNVFTMQWFLTLFSNCLPKATVLRVWDLIFLEGNEVLLRTALSIWGGLAERVLTVESADEFYSIMGVLTREMLEFGIMDANDLIKTICSMTPLSPSELNDMRDKYAYNIRPLTSPFSSFKKNLKLLYSDDEDECDDDNLAMATWCLSNTMHMPKAKGGSLGFGDISPGAVSHGFGENHPTPSTNNIDAERMSLDISALKKQYAKLRERQKQAHVILTGAFANNTFSRQRLPVAVNHLLVGKKPLVRKNKPTSKITFEFKSASKLPTEVVSKQIPPSVYHTADSIKNPPTVQITGDSGNTLSWAEVRKERQEKGVNNKHEESTLVETRDLSESSSCSSSSTELCDNVDPDEDYDDDRSSNLGDLSPDVSVVMTHLEEPLAGVTKSSSYEGDEDSISESTLIPSENTARNIPSPGGSNSTLGEDQLFSGSNSVRFEDTLGLSSYLSTYRKSQDISPLSESSPLGSEDKTNVKLFSPCRRNSQDLTPLTSSPDSDDNLDSASFMKKYKLSETISSDSDSPENDERLSISSYLAKYGLAKDFATKLPSEEAKNKSRDSSPIAESPEFNFEDLREKYGLTSFLTKSNYSQDTFEEKEKSREKSEESASGICTTKSPDNEKSDASSLVKEFTNAEENDLASKYTSSIETVTTTIKDTNDQYGLSSYLKDCGINSKSVSPTNSACKPVISMEKTSQSDYVSSYAFIHSKKTFSKSPDTSNEDSSPCDTSSDPPLSSPEVTSPEVEETKNQSASYGGCQVNVNSNHLQTAESSASVATLEKEDSRATRKTVSSNGSNSHSFNPFPTAKKIGYLANATAKLGLYSEKETFSFKEPTPRNNSYKTKFQLPKTLK